jgi:tripartite-type tricarboxylate transporter receptor subunit TctC
MKTVACCGRFVALLLVIACLPEAALSQAYPTKVVRLVVASNPGSGFDVIGRIVAGGLTEVFGQQVIVDNRRTDIAPEFAARAPADGYTILEIGSNHAAAMVLFKSLPYDLFRDFAPVTLLAFSPSVVVVHPSLPVKSINELVKLAKAKPGALNYAGTTAVGGATYMAGELFKSMANINMVHVPFRGGGEALTSVVSGETSVYFAPVATALPQIREGRLRALGVTSPQRLQLLPEYPTVAECGYPGFETGNWYGNLVPAKTPKPVITAIHEATAVALKKPMVSQRLGDLGYVIVAGPSEQFSEYLKTEIDRYSNILKDLRGTL